MGFHRGGYAKPELITLLKKQQTKTKNTLKSNEKFFEYTRKSLRSAKDILNKGGNVTTILKDQSFRLFHDNKRRIIEPKWCDDFYLFDLSNNLLDSDPFNDINHCKNKQKQNKKLRNLSNFPITLPFNNNTNISKSTYKSNIELGVRNFIKAYYSKIEKIRF